jgi:uncharacterized protein involved in oxidation of intracellular sulfur
MKLALILSTNDPETVFNAFRLGVFSLAAGDTVTVFLLGAAVEVESIPSDTFAVQERARSFLHDGGEILACGTCLNLRGLGPSELYHAGDLKALHDLIAGADKVVSF